MPEDSFARLWLHIMYRELQQRKANPWTVPQDWEKKVDGNEFNTPYFIDLTCCWILAQPTTHKSNTKPVACMEKKRHVHIHNIDQLLTSSTQLDHSIRMNYWPQFQKEKCIAELKDLKFGWHIVRHESWHIALFPNGQKSIKS